MTLSNGLLAAAGIGGLALTGMGTYAMHNIPTDEALDTNRPQMVREIGSGDMKEFKGPEFMMENLTANLSDEDKEAVETLLTQYREDEKAFHKAVEKATESIKEEWEANKTAYKDSILAIVGEENQEAVEAMFSRGHGKGGMGMKGKRPDQLPNLNNGESSELPNFENGERPELPDLGNGGRPEVLNFENGEGPELLDFENGERPELPEMNNEGNQQRPEMNGERPQFGGPRGDMQGNPQENQESTK